MKETTRRQFCSAAASASLARTAAPGAPRSHWATVPLFAHVAKFEGNFTHEEATFLASRYAIVNLSNGQARGAGLSVERGIYHAARQLKTINPAVKTLFYLNTVIDYPGYDARAESDRHPEWSLRDKDGRPVEIRGRRTWDLSNPEMRAWWVGICAKAIAEAPLDGVFADAVPKVGMMAAENRRLWGDRKYEAVEEGLRRLLAEVKRVIGPERLLIFNGLRGDLRRWADGGMKYLEHADGAMIEHFAAFGARTRKGSIDPEILRADLELMRQAREKGKIVQVRGWPKSIPFAPGEPSALSAAEKTAIARKEIGFPLAAFLAGAHDRAYFSYAWGYRSPDGSLARFSELERPLGAPREAMRRTGWTLRRNYEQASVTLDLEAEKAEIVWR